jgi:hypothetical protein
MQWGLTEPNFYWELDENLYLKMQVKHGKELQAKKTAYVSDFQCK